MRRVRLLLLVALGLVSLGSARAEETGGICSAPEAPVFIVLVGSAPQVAAAANGLSPTRVLVNTADTVIYSDGRAVTSNLASVSQHLNALGWASRPIEIAGAGTLQPAASTTRRRG